MSKGRRFHRGFSLVETVISAAIVGVVLVAALNTLAGVGAARVRSLDRVRAALLADELVAEISRQAYQEPGATTLLLGPELGEVVGNSRSAFDDVDDYNGLEDSPPCDRSGAPLDDYTGWKLSVLVEWVNPLSLDGSYLVDTGYKLITVTAETPENETVSRRMLSTGVAGLQVILDLGGGKVTISL